VPEFDARKSLILGKAAREPGTIMAQDRKMRTAIVHSGYPPSQ
jgi:hypothetical protein